MFVTAKPERASEARGLEARKRTESTTKTMVRREKRMLTPCQPRKDAPPVLANLLEHTCRPRLATTSSPQRGSSMPPRSRPMDLAILFLTSTGDTSPTTTLSLAASASSRSAPRRRAVGLKKLRQSTPAATLQTQGALAPRACSACQQLFGPAPCKPCAIPGLEHGDTKSCFFMTPRRSRRLFVAFQ